MLFDNFYVPSDSSIAWDTEAITPVAALEDCAENLTANLLLAYLVTDYDEKVWGDVKFDNAFRGTLNFTYAF